jgi:hypothetical protein
MDNRDASQAIEALHKISVHQNAQVAALQAVVDGLIGAIGQNYPSLVPGMMKNIETSANISREHLERETLDLFNLRIEQLLNAMRHLG